MKRFFLSALLGFVAIMSAFASDPNLVISGVEGNYAIGSFAKGSVIFLNRTMTFGDIPEQFAGWQFTQINAYSTWNGGPSPELVAKPSANGYIYCIVDISLQTDIVDPWAEDNGWTKINGIEISYGANANQKFYAYRKACVANEEITIVEPTTFSRCILIAPELTKAEPEPTYFAPDLTVTGAEGNYVIGDFAQGSTVFLNRTMTFGAIPEQFEGWKYTKINAFSTYNGGPSPELVVKPKEDGYLYCIVDISLQESIVDPWATENGWTKIDGIEISYGANANQKFYAYRKECVADEEITIVEPATFSRCIIIAPEMTEAVPVVTYDAVAIDISSKGWMETQVFENGATVFGNRAFVYHSAKARLNGLYVIRYNGGAAPQLTVRAQADGDMYIAQCTTLTDTYDVAANGWTAVTEDDVDLRYNDGTNTPFKLYKRAVTTGETIQINSTSWAGILVFSSEEITYRILTDVTVSATQYATMVTPYTVDLEAWNTDAGITAYAVSIDETGQPTYTETTGVVSAGTPLLIQGEAGTYTIPYSYNAPGVLETELQAVTAETEADGTQYVLDYRDGELGWYKQTTGTLAAGQCFLTFPEGTDDFVPMESEIVIPDYTPSDIVISGTEGNYIIGDFAQGSVVFMNRTFTFGVIPEQFEGWKYTKIYAYSSYNGGPSPQLVATPKSDGYIYCIVDIEKQNDVVVPWAAANGWTRVDDIEIAYGANANQKFYVYRKPCVADEKISIVEPATFSRCILIAPSITESEEPVEQVDAVAVSIEARGWMEVTTLANGNTAFANRSYTYNSVRKELSGLYVTRYNGGNAPSLLVTAQADGDLYIAQADGDNSYDVVAEGWTLVPDYTFHYNDGTNTSFTVYKRTVTEGEVVIIHTTAWQGILVLSSSAITYNLLSPIIPPVPGVVVHHSIASSKQFVGSPSIVKLNDGTLIASNDHFGSSFISNTFVSRSTDGGETWEQIAEIERLNWSKLFTRGDELYLLGVAPRVPIGYGDIVILRSNDGGATWTKPFDTEHGLLRVGYYHCAPTPVVHHNGRLWRGMENQGQDGGWGPFGAFIMSVPDSVNLLRSLNWRFTNELQYTAGAVDAFTWLEGNAVVTREGEMVDVLRLHYLPDDRAAIAHVSEDGRQFTFDPQNDISYLPGACKKFTINFDSVSNRYWTISNYVLPQFRNNDTGSTRNTLALSWSYDLVHWTIKDILLHTDEIGIRAFQYADWLIDGDDILAVVRTAWPDESGNADSPHNANYLTFHRFRNFRYENPDELKGAVEVKKWHGGAQSAMALTFDDGFKAHHDYAVPVLNNYDIPSTFFLITQEIVHQGQTPKARYGIWEDFREMADQGHEIASHTVSHPNLIGMSVEAMEQELADSRAAIEENIGQRCFSLAYPYCNHDGDVDILTAQHYEVARACGGLTNPASLTDAGRMGVNSHMVTWLYPRSLTNETTSFNALKVMTEEDLIPEGGFGVVCIHEVLPFDKLGESDTYEVATTEWLENVCQFLSEKREAGEIWPTTLSHITKYARERDNLSVKRTLNATEDTLCYDFSTRLNPTIYDEPLTLSLQVPEGWTDVRCLVMEGEMLAEEIACDPESNEVVVDVIPDLQSVIFVREIEPVGVGSVTTKKVFSYPVPAKVTAYVQFGENVEGSCQLLNMSGQVVKNLGHQHSVDGVITVPVAGLPAGMYMLRLNDGCTNRTVRILKK